MKPYVGGLEAKSIAAHLGGFAPQTLNGSIGGEAIGLPP